MWGVQKEYWDIFGRHHVAPPEVQAAILRSLGIAVGSIESIDSAVEARLWNDWYLPVSPTLVIRLSDGVLPVQIPEGDECNNLQAHFTWEDGTSDSIRASPASLEPAGWAEIRGRRFNRLRLPLPPAAMLGYHTLRVTCGGNSTESRLILCPDRAFKPEFLERGEKTAGIAVSLYGLRSDRNWGCGDFSDLEHFVQWAEDVLEGQLRGSESIALHSKPPAL